MATEHKPQRIARLTPLTDVLARIDALVKPVASRDIELAAAAGRTLAVDVVAAPRPSGAIALRDGFAVRADLTADASSYAPVMLTEAPPRVDVGEVLPAGTDAVAPLDAVLVGDGRHQALVPVTPGDGVLLPNGDIGANDILRCGGERLRDADVAVFAAAGLAHVRVREPHIRVMRARTVGDAVLDAARDLIGRSAAAEGAVLRNDDVDFAAASANSDSDALIIIGGTGSGRNDESVHALARAGRIEFHGIALMPGETAAFGMIGTTPVLLVPGRLDAALAVWLTLGRRLLARLTGSVTEPATTRAELARKIASPLGFAEIVPVRCRDGKAEPIASGYWPLLTIAQSDVWLMVPADSEGYPAGAEVVLRPF